MKFGEISKVVDESLKESKEVIDNISEKYIYFSKLRDDTDELNPNVGFHAKTSVIEIFYDYRKVTPVDNCVNALLDHRGNWKRISDPYNYKVINFSFVGSDIALASNKFFKFDIVDGDKVEPFSIELKKMFVGDDVNAEYIQKYQSAIQEVKNMRLSKESMEKYKNSANINRLILEKSQVGNRLTKFTRWIGDKIVLYNMIRSYSGDYHNSFIPATFEIDFYKIEKKIQTDDNELMQRLKQEEINNILELHLNSAKKDDVWVVKPTHGSRGTGMKFWKTDDVKALFYRHALSVFETEGYYLWMISKFIKSFSWKLKNDAPESITKLITDKLWNHVPVIRKFEDDGPPDPLRTEYVDKIGRKFKYLQMINPSEISSNASEQQISKSDVYKRFREHKFSDSKGRINKGRIWFVVELSNDEYKLYVYHKLLFEICVKEFSENYTDPMEVWTDANEYYYGTGYNERNRNEKNKDYKGDYKLDKVNAVRATELDLYYTVDWNTGEWFQNGSPQKFPIDWAKAKTSFSNFFEVFMSATKDSVHCLSANNINKKGCFQYVGMDFIIDENSSVWLLEMNTRPWIGYGNWWNKFDPNNNHVLNKMVFVESLLRKFIDPKFPGKIKLPYKTSRKTDVPHDINEHSWVEVIAEDHVGLKDPIAINSMFLPQKGMANWVMTRQIRTALRGRGWSIFPYSSLVSNPKLIMQGMTPLINYLLMTYAGKPEDLHAHLVKNYPDLLKADTINRIFPLVVYLGNKSRLVTKLENAFPASPRKTYKSEMANYIPWYEIVPFSFTVKKFNGKVQRSKEEIMNNIRAEVSKMSSASETLIIKPSLGKQGTGIMISNDIGVLADTVVNSPENQDEQDWVVSKYLGNPLTVYNRKTHIRVFVLVHNKEKRVNVYLMEPHLLFLAGLPYDDQKALEFYNLYFSDDGKKLIKGDMKKIEKYKNLTNLSKGTELFTTFLGKKNQWDVIAEKNKTNKDVTAIEQRLAKKTTWLNSDGKMNVKFGYSVLSGKARDEYPKGAAEYDEKIVPQIIRVVNQTVFSVKDDISCVNDKNCYHYLAFDLMITNPEKPGGDPHVWLLEVNVNPGLNAPTQQLKDEGGMTGFMNSIFTYVLDDKSTLETVKFEPNTIFAKYPKDGKHKELEGSVWVDKEHKKGDQKYYTYDKIAGGDMYNDDGKQITIPGYENKSWRKGDVMYRTIEGEYFIPEKYRGNDREWYADNTRKLVKKYPSVFHEILTMESNPSNKSKDVITSAIISNHIAENQSSYNNNFPFGSRDFNYFVGQHPLPPHFIRKFREWSKTHEVYDAKKGYWIPVFYSDDHERKDGKIKLNGTWYDEGDLVIAFSNNRKLPRLRKKYLSKILRIKSSHVKKTNKGWRCLDLKEEKLDSMLQKLKIPHYEDMENNDQRCILLGIYSYLINVDFPYVSNTVSAENHPIIRGWENDIKRCGFLENPFEQMDAPNDPDDDAPDDDGLNAPDDNIDD